MPNRVKEANPQLLYYSIYLSCVFGGKNIRTKVQDKEEHSCKCLTQFIASSIESCAEYYCSTACSTLKQGCKAHIKFELSSDCQSLQVTEINEDHNHEVSKV